MSKYSNSTDPASTKHLKNSEKLWRAIQLSPRKIRQPGRLHSSNVVIPSDNAGTNVRIRKADHPINAMLNYGYAVLESQIRLAVVARGYATYFGIFHGKYEERPSYVLGLIEPHRPEVDKAVLEIELNERFSVKDFNIRQGEMCRLAPQLTEATVQFTSARVSIELLGNVLYLRFEVNLQSLNHYRIRHIQMSVEFEILRQSRN